MFQFDDEDQRFQSFHLKQQFKVETGFKVETREVKSVLALCVWVVALPWQR